MSYIEWLKSESKLERTYGDTPSTDLYVEVLETALAMAVAQMYGDHGMGNPFPLCSACQSRVDIFLSEAKDVVVSEGECECVIE